MIWDLFQQYQIRTLTKDTLDAQSGVREKNATVRSVEERLEALSLICRAMWELQSARGGLSEADLLAKIEEIDLRDGQRDGKYKPSHTCQACHRQLNARHSNCIYCGSAVESTSAFDKV